MLAHVFVAIAGSPCSTLQRSSRVLRSPTACERPCDECPASTNAEDLLKAYNLAIVADAPALALCLCATQDMVQNSSLGNCEVPWNPMCATTACNDVASLGCSGGTFNSGTAYPPTPTAHLSGLGCSNGYSQCNGCDLNQGYVQVGHTADGRPYYQGVTHRSIYLYYDSNCGGANDGARWRMGWILGCGEPSISASSNLLGSTDGGCCNHANVDGADTTPLPPAGVTTWHQWYRHPRTDPPRPRASEHGSSE